MKIKIQNKQMQESAVVVGTVAGILAILAFLAKKFFGEAKEEISSAGKTIDTADKQINDVLEQENTPVAKDISQQVIISKRKLFATLKKVEEEAKQVDTAAEMSEKPSVIMARAIEEYEYQIDMATAGKKLKPETIQKIEQAKKDIKRSAKIIKNIDKLVMLVSKKQPNGLWQSVVAKDKLATVFSDDKNWKAFTQMMFDNYIQ